MNANLDNPDTVGAGYAYGALCSEGERQANEEAELAARFVCTVMVANSMGQLTDIDGDRNNWSYLVDGKPTRRLPSVGEIMFDYFEYTRKAPKWDDLMNLLVRIAKTGDAEAMMIINKLAAAYAWMKMGDES